MKAKFNGKALADARKAAGLDQAELARRVSRNRVTISDIEREKLQPGTSLAKKLAEELSLDLDQLYRTPEESGIGGVKLTIEELQVIDAMRRLPDVQRAKIWAFAQGLAASGSPQGATSAAELAEAIEQSRRAEQSQGETQTGSA